MKILTGIALPTYIVNDYIRVLPVLSWNHRPAHPVSAGATSHSGWHLLPALPSRAPNDKVCFDIKLASQFALIG